MKNVHLVANAHIDPIWQWEWEEGAACGISTFRTAVEICEANPDFIFCHNESLLYQWIEEFDPSLFKRIEKLVAEDRWHIMGAWVDQPDCNMPSGESFIRQMRLGKGYFMKKFGKTSTCAINLDPFGHTRGMVQLMKKAGFKHYIICRPDPKDIPMPAEDAFIWKGFDGSEITVRWTNGYSSSLGKVDTSKICPTLKNYPNMQPGFIMWGVGDHGGGPSKQDIEIIKRLKEEYAKEGINLIHSTPDKYFEEREAENRPMQVVEKDINPWAIGCYTSEMPIKQAHRQLEEILSFTEKICSHAAAMGLMEYPAEDLHEAEYDLCLCEFHDVLPGSSMESAEKMAVRALNHGIEICSRLRARAFFRISASQPKAKLGELPVMAYNPHPYPVTGEFTVEFMLHDQNWEPFVIVPRIYKDGVELPSQCEKEASTIPLDWRKRLVFRATLDPMTITRFDINLDKRADENPVPRCGGNEDEFIFNNGTMEAHVSKKSGLLTSYRVGGKEYLTSPVRPVMVEDTCDPWGMTVSRFDGKISEFRLATKEETREYCGYDDGELLGKGHEYDPELMLEPVHVIESGAVRTTIESVLVNGKTTVLMRYVLPAADSAIEVKPHVSFNARNQLLKLVVPTALSSHYYGQQPYGYETLDNKGREVCSQRWVMAAGETDALSILTGVYGSDCTDGVIRLTLQRGPGYTAHPLGDRKILPTDRYNQHSGQGEFDFSFQLNAGEVNERLNKVEREAAAYWEQPFVVNFFPAAEGELPRTLAEIKDECVTLGTFKASEDGSAYVARVFNPTSKPRTVSLDLPYFGHSHSLTLQPFEVRTLKISKDGAEANECNILE